MTEWIKSSFCQNSACIEVSRQNDPEEGDNIVLRNNDVAFHMTPEDWDALCEGIRNREFDALTQGPQGLPMRKVGPKKVKVFYNDRDIANLECSELVVLEDAVWLKGMLGAGMTVTDEDMLIPFSSIKNIHVT
jgi:hypothetical protein